MRFQETRRGGSGGLAPGVSAKLSSAKCYARHLVVVEVDGLVARLQRSQ